MHTPVRAAVISLVPIGALSAVTFLGFAGRESPALLALDVLAAVLALALLLIVVHLPLAVEHPDRLRLTMIACVALVLLPAASPTATVAATVGVLLTARWRPLLQAVPVGLAGLAAQAIQGAWRDDRGLPYPWWLLLMTIAYAGLVGWGALWQARAALLDSLRERARRLEADQEHRIAEARAAERNRIAREMHDVLAHRLSLVATYAGALEYRPDAPPERLAAAAGVVRESVHQALGELREVITLLRDDTEEAVALADLPALVAEARAAGQDVTFADDIDQPVPETTGRAAYRIVQEGLTNARKHAPGVPVSVTLVRDHDLVVTVTNPLRTASRIPDGPAPAVSAPAVAGPHAPGPAEPGSGLIGLAERARLAGGRIEHDADGVRFRLRAWLPLPS